MSDNIINNHLSDEQISAVLKLHRAQRGIAYWKMGEGKTRIALALFEHLNPPITQSICLIVCRRKAFDTWRDEIRKVQVRWYINEFPNLTAPPTSASRPTVWLISHAMLHKVYSKLYQFRSIISCLIFDELYLYSNPRSALTLAAVSLANHLSPPARVYGLSGTIMSAGDVVSIFSQSQVIGISGRIANNLTDFHSKYQISFQLDFGRGKFLKFKNRPDAFKRIQQAIRPNTHVHFPTNTGRQDVETDISCALSPKQQQYIQKLKEEYFLEIEDGNVAMELRSTLELVHRVSQISNGYLHSGTGELHTFPSPKVEALQNKIEEILGAEERAVVWCYYTSDIDYLKGIFKYIPTVEMSGRHEFNRTRWHGRQANVVLATVGVGSSFNDFAQVQYGLYFSHSYKFLELEQSKARSSRRDSAHTTSYYYHFTSQRTFDQRILKCARQSEISQQDFIKQCQNILPSI